MSNQTKHTALQRHDNCLIDWGREVTVDGVQGEGGARVFLGEDFEIMKLVLAHTQQVRIPTVKSVDTWRP